MTRTEVREFIEAGTEALESSIQFNSGRISEFNSARDNEYPFIWLESLSTAVDILDSGLPYDNWTIALHIAKKDAIDSSPEQYEEIIDSCDLIAQKLIKLYNQNVSGYNLVVLESVGRRPFIKLNADCITGIILSFTLRAPDTAELC